jgi:hypothetical protein
LTNALAYFELLLKDEELACFLMLKLGACTIKLYRFVMQSTGQTTQQACAGNPC